MEDKRGFRVIDIQVKEPETFTDDLMGTKHQETTVTLKLHSNGNTSEITKEQIMDYLIKVLDQKVIA